MLNNIDEDEKTKKVTPIYNVYNGQYENQECLFLTEDGLYEVLMQSRKPIAKAFKKEVKQNIKRFKESIDFIDLKGVGESHTLTSLGYIKQSITQAKNIYLLSERGYAKLVKIMDTDLAWEMLRIGQNIKT